MPFLQLQLQYRLIRQAAINLRHRAARQIFMNTPVFLNTGCFATTTPVYHTNGNAAFKLLSNSNPVMIALFGLIAFNWWTRCIFLNPMTNSY